MSDRLLVVANRLPGTLGSQRMVSTQSQAAAAWRQDYGRGTKVPTLCGLAGQAISRERPPPSERRVTASWVNDGWCPYTCRRIR